MVEGVEDFDDAERCGMKDDDGAEGVVDVGGVADVNDAGRDAGRDDSVVTGTGKDRVFFPRRCTWTVAAVDAAAAVAARRCRPEG